MRLAGGESDSWVGRRLLSSAASTLIDPKTAFLTPGVPLVDSLCFRDGARGAPRDGAQYLAWIRRAAAGADGLAAAETELGTAH